MTTPVSRLSWIINGAMIGLVVGGFIYGCAAVTYLLLHAIWTVLGVWSLVIFLAIWAGWGIANGNNEARNA